MNSLNLGFWKVQSDGYGHHDEYKRRDVIKGHSTKHRQNGGNGNQYDYDDYLNYLYESYGYKRIEANKHSKDDGEYEKIHHESYANKEDDDDSKNIKKSFDYGF